MDFQQKAAALRALGEITIRLRDPAYCVGPLASKYENSWYASIQGAEIKDKSILRGDYGNGATPEAAVLDAWRAYVDDVVAPLYVVLFAGDPSKRRAVRWNGFMWSDVREMETV